MRLDNCPCRDAQAIAYYTGQADARNGRPRRHVTADSSMLGRAYTRGYDDLERQREAS